MADRPPSYIAQEWSVHAQLTISHQPTPDVRMEYSWAPSSEPRPCYGFQRGNIVFTTRPSPPVYGSLPSRRPAQPYSRRCRSTCNITLQESSPPTTTEGCEVCGGERSPLATRRATNYTTHFCTRVPDKASNRLSQDVASQTDGFKTQQTQTQADAPEPDLPSSKSVKRLSRSPAHLSGKAPKVLSRKSSSHSPEQKTKPRTVHIDVYCTGSDVSDSPSDSDTGSDSSPQTVFESEKVRVTHTRAGKDRLPLALTTSEQPHESQKPKEECTARAYDSDDGLSSHYPSRFSSYTSFQGSVTSRDPSSSTISSSSCALSDSSWKDTVTDVESLANSDSFDYADSIDRLRIRERERAWAAREDSKTWRSPQSERRRQRLQEFVEKRMSQGSFPLWKAGKSEESEDDGDETGDAWSFGGGISPRPSTLKREDTVRKATPSTLTTQPPPSTPTAGIDTSPLRRGIRSSSPMPSKVESSITSPFATHVGLRTDQLSRAERFGTIVGAFRKPGHHIGPSKNPECSCAHCRNYFFEQDECRGRTRSLDVSLETASNWRLQLQNRIAVTLRGKSEELKSSEDQWDDSNAV